MIRTIIAALFSLLSLLPALAASPVDTAARKAAGAPALKAVFTLNGAPGSLLMCGKMFAVDLPEMKIHFDGTTQWTHSVPDAEITIVTPTDAEIAQINPLAFLGSLRGEFNVSDLSGGNVRLLPKDTSSGIDEIVALFSNSTRWPVQIRMTSSGHTALIDQITVTILDKPLPPSTFTVTPAKGVTVVDLR